MPAQTSTLRRGGRPAPGRIAAARSSVASKLLNDLLAVPPTVRWRAMRDLSEADVTALMVESGRLLGTPYALWQGDPVAFVEQVLGEAIWSAQKTLLRSMVHNQITAVPSCFGSGKTRSAALATCYFYMVYPPGTAKVVTIAPRWRQVLRQVWPEIRGIATRAQLPGKIDQAQWTIVDQNGLEHREAYGIAAAPHAEDAVQGIHAPNLLLVVDEAGGIAPKIGRNMAGLLTGSNSHMLAIGNPPTDEENTWFEQLCNRGKANVVRISAYSTPAFTGEETPWCRSCPEAVPAHRLVTHLVDQAWVADAIDDHGSDSRYVTAKVHAQFPRGGPNTLIPYDWVLAAQTLDEPDDPAAVPLDSLGIPGETRDSLVMPKSWVRLGVDVASDGGDELAIARVVGDLVTLEHTSAGQDNYNAIHVAGKVLEHIRAAHLLAQKLGSEQRVRVKIDSIGVGWGVASQLELWREEGKHSADIVRVDVREKPRRTPDAATLRPERKRDEMWLAMRSLLQPRPPDREPAIRLRVDDRTANQLSAPRYSTSSNGNTVVESKDSMRKRGVRSPDRAEACCLAVYEPGGRRVRLIV